MQQQAPQAMNQAHPAAINVVSTEQIQKYLDENKNLIVAILENQNMGKIAECARPTPRGSVKWRETAEWRENPLQQSRYKMAEWRWVNSHPLFQAVNCSPRYPQTLLPLKQPPYGALVFPSDAEQILPHRPASRALLLSEGKMIHGLATKLGYHFDPFVETALVGMYAACGLISEARLVFDKMPHRDVVTKNIRGPSCVR